MSAGLSIAVICATPADTDVCIHGSESRHPGLTALRIGPATLQWDTPTAARDWLVHCLDQLDVLDPVVAVTA